MQTEHTATKETTPAERKRRIGFFLVAMGAFLCIFGFLITMLLLAQGVNFNLALYGATGLGGGMLLGGMIAIMG